MVRGSVGRHRWLSVRVEQLYGTVLHFLVNLPGSVLVLNPEHCVQPADPGLVRLCELLEVEPGQMQQWLCHRKESPTLTILNVVFFPSMMI